MTALQEPKINIRKANERGHADHGWLNSYHTFSFADYYDPRFMGFRTLRVINDDTVSPGQGFGAHAHHDMEIISYVISGALEHKDSMGNGSVIEPGNVQCISAGTGIKHSEFNHSKKENVHFLQIWIVPDRQGLKPSYQEAKIGRENNQVLNLIGSPDGREKSALIHQDVFLYFGKMKMGEVQIYQTETQRGIWVQLIDGKIEVEAHALQPGDGISIESISKLNIKGIGSSQFLLFDLK